MKIAKSFEDSGLLIKGFSETIPKEAKEQRVGFLRFLLGILGAILLENMLADNGVYRADEGVNRADKGVNRTGQYF